MSKLPPTPVGVPPGHSYWNDWYERLRTLVNNTLLNHNDLQNIQGGSAGSRYHITQTQHTDLSRFTANTDQGTLNLSMGFGGASLQLGQEVYFPPVLNNTGSTITNGTLVGFSGVSGADPTIHKHLSDGSMSPLYIMGITTMDIPNGQRGLVTQFGYIHDTDTTGTPYGETWVVGDILYGSPTTAGGLTKTKPTAPNTSLPVAAVMTVSSTVGLLIVRVLPQQELFYGWFADSTDQTIGTANTPQTVTFNTTNNSNGISRGTPTSRIVCANSGLYQFQFSLQIESTTASSVFVTIWPRKNGTDITNSATTITIKSNSDVIVPSWDFIVSMAASDYFELVWAADSTSVSLSAHAAQTVPFIRPSIPSALMSVTQINL